MSTPRVINAKNGYGNHGYLTYRQRLRCMVSAASTYSKNKKVQPSLPKLTFMQTQKQEDKR